MTINMKTNGENTKNNLQKERRVRVETSLLRQWKMKLEHGDIKQIAGAMDIGEPTIATALKGLATPSVRDGITEFLKSKQPA